MATVKVQYEVLSVPIAATTTGTSGFEAETDRITALLHSIKITVPTWSSSAATACYVDVKDSDGFTLLTTDALANATSYVITADRMLVSEQATIRVRTNSIESTGGQPVSDDLTVKMFLY